MKYYLYSIAVVLIGTLGAFGIAYIVDGVSPDEFFVILLSSFIVLLITIYGIVPPFALKEALKDLTTKERSRYAVIEQIEKSTSRRLLLIRNIKRGRKENEIIVANPRAAEEGDSEAQMKLGMALKELDREEEAEVWIRRAAEQNEPDAQMLVGATLMSKADEDPEAATEALKWLMLAIASGHNHPWKKANEAPIFAQKLRESMTQEQILEAGRRASNWKPTIESK